MYCVCGIAFLCGSTLVKVPLLQAGTVAIWPQMFQSDVKPKQTNKKVTPSNVTFCRALPRTVGYLYVVGAASRVRYALELTYYRYLYKWFLITTPVLNEYTQNTHKLAKNLETHWCNVAAFFSLHCYHREMALPLNSIEHDKPISLIDLKNRHFTNSIIYNSLYFIWIPFDK